MWHIAFSMLFCLITAARPAAAEWTVEKLRDARIEALESQEAAAKDALQITFSKYRSMLDDLLSPQRADDFHPEHTPEVAALASDCKQQDWDACHTLAGMLDAGRATFRDRPLAQGIYWLGCHAKHGPSCVRLFETPARETDQPFTGISPAKSFYTEACMSGDAKACRALAANYRHAFTTDYPGLYPRDPDLAEAMADLACQFDPDHASCPAQPEPSDEDVRHRQLVAGCAAANSTQCSKLADALSAERKPDQAFEVRTKACDLGDLWSCHIAADNLLHGTTVAPDAERALGLMAQSCDDHAYGCGRLAQVYLARGAVDMARPLFHAICQDQGGRPDEIAWACTQIIEMGADILSPEIETKVALELREHVHQTRVGCQNGDASACRALAITAQGYRDAPLFMHSYKALMQRACDLGHLGSCSEITHAIYEPNSNHPHDRGCAAGFPEACTRALAQDLTLAPEMRMNGLQDLCARGNGPACSRRGLALQRIDDLLLAPRGTWGPVRDHDAALASYQAGCNLMDGPSCAWLALLRDPAVSDRDTAHLKTTAQEAQSLYLKACEFGYGWGCTKLAYDEMYMKSATETNFDRTLELALIGCRDGQNCVEFFQARLKRDHAQLVADHGTVPAALMERYDMVTPSWHGPVRRLRRSCARDVTADCIALGALFDAAGQGDNSKMRYQTPYPEISQALYLHACDLKDGDGCAVLGERLKDGLIRNPERALTYAKRGCDLGSSKACFLAASFYEVYSEYPDRALAYFYTQKACLGDRSLQCQIMHKPGDDARAAKMERRVLGCVHGEATTCFLIAENRFKNSPEMRHDLHQIGCHLGETRSCDALKRIP